MLQRSLSLSPDPKMISPPTLDASYIPQNAFGFISEFNFLLTRVPPGNGALTTIVN